MTAKKRPGPPFSCIAVAGMAEEVITVETGKADWLANMHAFAAAALELLKRHLSR